MIKTSLMQGWAVLVGSFAVISLILIALGLMVGIVKTADAPKRIGTIVSIVIILIVFPAFVASAWLALSLWQQIALVAFAVVIWQLRRPRRRMWKGKGE